MEVLGTADFDIVVGGKVCRQECLVSDMSSLGIEVYLGADFHQVHDLSARYATGEAYLVYQ